MIAAIDRLVRRVRGERATDLSQPLPDRVSIFVTVGTELPFDRLVRVIDEWAGQAGRGADVFAQIGHTDFHPTHIGWTETIDGPDFRRLFAGADLIVAHAGMGTILAALEQRRPLVVVPRRADLGEHRNDHQLATVARLSKQGSVNAAADELEVIAYLDGEREVRITPSIDDVAPDILVDRIRSAIHDG